MERYAPETGSLPRRHVTPEAMTYGFEDDRRHVTPEAMTYGFEDDSAMSRQRR